MYVLSNVGLVPYTCLVLSCLVSSRLVLSCLVLCCAHSGVRGQWCVLMACTLFKSWIIIDFGYYDGFVFFYRYFAFTTHPAGRGVCCLDVGTQLSPPLRRGNCPRVTHEAATRTLHCTTHVFKNVLDVVDVSVD